jgi:solute carrier family 13 (sodium-dependent dicarboxylate transporter), member 2/3/5
VEEPSAEEAPFDRVRRRVGIWLGPLLFVALLLAPLPLEPRAHRLAAVMALVIVYWITEPLPLAVTAFLGPSLAVLAGVAPARKTLEGFADPVIFLFLGSFLLAEALRVHGLDRRIALAILALRATLLLVGMAASLGGIATPVGTPPNLIAMGFLEQAGRAPSFLMFMAVGVPLSLVLTGVSVAVASRLLPGAPRVERAAEWVAQERAAMGRWTRGQRACAAAFGAAIFLWILPGILSFAARGSTVARVLGDRLEESVVALLCAALLFFWPATDGVEPVAPPRRRALEWRDARRIDWGTLLLFGGGLSLGRLAFETGLADVLGRGVVEATGVTTLWGLTALLLAVTIVLTETVSNTATVSMLAPLALALARQLGVPPEPPVLAVAFGASMGFMFPVGTPPNAIVYGTGLVPLTAMMRMGVIIDVLSFFVIFLGLRLLCPLLGMA